MFVSRRKFNHSTKTSYNSDETICLKKPLVLFLILYRLVFVKRSHILKQNSKHT